jgi:DNA mismatch repair protein MutS
MSQVTPVRKQYLDIKKQFPNAIVFFRLGDFYETFDADAELAARELDITLTSRNVAKDKRVPMAGVPYHAAEGYIARLIEKGYHVAICEQVSDEPIQGLMPREVVRVVTPGTVTEPALLPDKRNNYLAAVWPRYERDSLHVTHAGLAYADISTGEFAATQFEEGDVLGQVQHELARLMPREVLLPESLADSGLTPPGLDQIHITPMPDWRFDLGTASQALMDHFRVASLDGFGLADQPMATIAAGGVIQYLQQTQHGALDQLVSLATYTTGDYMVLDSAARRNLELTETIRGGQMRGSLLGVLDRTVTPMGGRLLRQWITRPLLNRAQLERRLDMVEALVNDGLLRATVRETLRGVSDLERLVNRVMNGSAGPRELISLRESLERVPTLQTLLLDRSAALADLAYDLNPVEEMVDLIAAALVDEPPATLSTTGIIRPGFSPELDAIVTATADARTWINGLEAVERERTGIKTLKVGYNKVFGYYLEVTKANAALVPDDYIRKQTLVNAERYITPELKEVEVRLLSAEEEIGALEVRIYRQLLRDAAAHSEMLLSTARALARLDVFASLAEVAARYDYVRPALTDDDVLSIHDGRHPVVELMLPGERFVPNDTVFSEAERIHVVTGPNMSGKSTILRQVALIVLLAQIGSFVPAREATIGLMDRIFTRIGAQDEIHAGQSTFMVEMVEMANILHHATRRSLIILDEIGRGTSTYDGLSIAWAVVEHLHNHPNLRAKTLFATHYHELTELAALLPCVANYNVAVAEEGDHVVFLHHIIPGGADRSYGIHVAQLAGLPRPVIQRAEEILAELESSKGPVVDADRTPAAMQMALFPQSSPILDELADLDVASMTPLEALNKLFEWQQRFGSNS